MSDLDDFLKDSNLDAVELESLKLHKMPEGVYQVKLEGMEFRPMGRAPSGRVLAERVSYNLELQASSDGSNVGRKLAHTVFANSKVYFKLDNIAMWTAFAPEIDADGLSTNFSATFKTLVKNNGDFLEGRSAVVRITKEADKNDPEKLYNKYTWAPAPKGE